MDHPELPIARHRQDLLRAIQDFPTLVVVGDTGSGKTTQLPQYILQWLTSENQDVSDTHEEDRTQEESAPKRRLSKIGITQPRRIAALSAAKRVSQELQERLGDVVGYSIRFEKLFSPQKTRLLYMTDGTLLRSCVQDPSLSDFDYILLDEAHERSLETDILFGLLRRAQRLRSSSSPNPLKLIIMSATLDMDKFSAFFNDCPVFSIPGRMFSVDILWQQKALKPSALKASYVQRAIETCMHIHKNEPPGDVYV